MNGVWTVGVISVPRAGRSLAQLTLSEYPARATCESLVSVAASTPMQTTGPHAALPVFVLAPAADLARELHLPSPSNNLFQRLIRNPHAESDRAKERECAEMLCALLQNAPGLRLQLLRWLGAKVLFDVEKLDRLRFNIDTEQPIGAKRDDLRIVGSPDGTEEQGPTLLWTVEVKVGASFHESAAQL